MKKCRYGTSIDKCIYTYTYVACLYNVHWFNDIEDKDIFRDVDIPMSLNTYL